MNETNGINVEQKKLTAPAPKLVRSGFAVIHDLCQLRDRLNALQEELVDIYECDGLDVDVAGGSLYSCDGNITRAIGEILHAEYKAERLVFVDQDGDEEAPSITEANPMGFSKERLAQLCPEARSLYAEAAEAIAAGMKGEGSIDKMDRKLVERFGSSAVEGTPQ